MTAEEKVRRALEVKWGKLWTSAREPDPEAREGSTMCGPPEGGYRPVGYSEPGVTRGSP